MSSLAQSTAQSRVIVLVGFMGAGKTTAGRRLAQHLGWRFLDLDDLIEERAGCAVRDIFCQSGETAFRLQESEALEALVAAPGDEPLVLALGGGAFAQPRNAATLLASGCPIVFLDAAPEELRRRCSLHGDTRPLFQDAAQFEQLYASRRAAYLAAPLRLDTTELSFDQVISELLRLLAFDVPQPASGGIAAPDQDRPQ